MFIRMQLYQLSCVIVWHHCGLLGLQHHLRSPWWLQGSVVHECHIDHRDSALLLSSQYPAICTGIQLNRATSKAGYGKTVMPTLNISAARCDLLVELYPADRFVTSNRD